MTDPWDDPQRASYWISRTSTAVDVHTIKHLIWQLQRTWHDTKERRLILEQMRRRCEELAQRS